MPSFDATGMPTFVKLGFTPFSASTYWCSVGHGILTMAINNSSIIIPFPQFPTKPQEVNVSAFRQEVGTVFWYFA